MKRRNTRQRRKRKSSDSEGSSEDPKVRHKKPNREKAEFALIVAEDEADPTRQTPWSAIAADGPSELPPRRLCAVCSLLADHQCPSCFKAKLPPRYICSIECFNIHKDSDCGKPRNWLL